VDHVNFSLAPQNRIVQKGLEGAWDSGIAPEDGYRFLVNAMSQPTTTLGRRGDQS